ncbi:glycosyltransferase [Thermoproteus tenax]|uniref:Glycosyltransferase (Type 1) n=1 Tax=Thermoproteus tenax (strain ATCC 35583 / DSM 2078 / JCM 9277 / NBRC 100435 / Kra 1) TaxID=768679 RepID=G4RK70_THETK|nr:glycosyltransferase [Thermoproteus tenax]CCC81965.1 glycosyltransferase (type 1) [Thermoproteus tenax Kra 1]
MERYAVVAHRYWGSPGGGQLVCAAAAKALDEGGYKPVLTGTFKFDPSRYIEWYGIDLAKYPTITMPVGPRAFGLWSRLLMWMPAKRAIERYRPEVLFIDDAAYKPIAADKSFRLIEYIHFPLEVYVRSDLRELRDKFSEDPYIVERYGRFPLNIYWRIFTSLLPRYARDNPFRYADVVLTNSKWTAQVAKLVYGQEPRVLNPPLPPNVEVVERPRPFEERRPWVVMLGRFSQEKRYHWVVTEVAPRLIKEVPGAKIVIFGGAATPTLQAYRERVRKLAAGVGLKTAEDLGADADVYLIANAPRRLINDAMDKARAFLHATINEHWGIAVAEAMARGLTPVVHKSGGAWTDLVMEGRYGLGYTTAEEAAEALAKALTQELKINPAERAAGLTYPHFAKALLELVAR